MSLKTWKEEFYPVPADAPSAQASEQAAVEHCIQKWEGLREDNLVKHKMVLDGVLLRENTLMDRTLRITDKSCALCVFHGYDADVPAACAIVACETCVLSKVNHGFPCYDSASSNNKPPYQAFIIDGCPAPMLELLYNAREYLKTENEKNSTSPSS